MREWEKWEKAANTSNIFSYASNILLDYVKQGIENNIEENKSLIIPQAVLHIFSSLMITFKGHLLNVSF